MATLQSLKTELTTDPLGRGYGPMSHAAAAADLDLPYRLVDRVDMTAAEIFECLVLAEYNALTAGGPKRNQVDTILRLVGSVSVAQGSRAREWLMDAYPAGTATRTAFGLVAQMKISRSVELWGTELVQAFGYATGAECVQKARALP